MTNYFIHDGDKKTGSFTLDDIKQKRIEENTMIWFDGLDKWTEAKNILELKDTIIKSPPPLEKISQMQQTFDKTKKILETDFVEEIENKIPNKNGKTFFKWAIILFAVIGVFFIGKNLFKKGSISLGSFNALDSAVLKTTGVAHEDWYEKGKMNVSISGDMLNKSSVYSYKDFVVEVKYLTETNTLVETKQYTIYQSIKPLDKKDFSAKLDGEIPSGSKYYKLEWKLIDAIQFLPKKETE